MWPTIALDMPAKPFPGQLRPDAQGRCPSKAQVHINGGCWLKLALEPKDCDEDYYVYKAACYIPVMRAPRPGTSCPAD